MSKNMKTVATLAGDTPFTEAQIRWWINQASQNGLERSGALIRIGRRIYIDTDRFDAWLDSMSKPKAGAV